MKPRARALSTACDPALAMVRPADQTLALDDGRSMDIVLDFPPNISEIEMFVPGIRSMPGVIFAYGRLLYNPFSGVIEKWLLAHELTHTAQQGNSVAQWWRRYLEDMDFRFEQEVESHRAEYRELVRRVRDQRKRQAWVREIAEKLTRPVYGGRLSFGEALKTIRDRG